MRLTNYNRYFIKDYDEDEKGIVLCVFASRFRWDDVFCSDVKTDVKKLEGKWNVVEVKGEKVLEEGLPQMDFNMAEKKLHGNTGCNLFNTTITLDPEDVSSITIAPGATTMMACPNMDLETSVLQSMDQVRSVKGGKDENEMLLVDQDGNVLLVLERN